MKKLFALILIGVIADSQVCAMEFVDSTVYKNTARAGLVSLMGFTMFHGIK